MTLKSHHARPYPILMYDRATKLHWLAATAIEERNGKRGNRGLAHVRFPLETRRRSPRRYTKKARKRGRRREVEVRRDSIPRDSLLLYKTWYVVFWSIIVTDCKPDIYEFQDVQTGKSIEILNRFIRLNFSRYFFLFRGDRIQWYLFFSCTSYYFRYTRNAIIYI